MKFHGHIALILLCLLWLGCKEKPIPKVPFDYENGILVVNEGNFQGGNSSLSFVRRTDDSLRNDIFALANERPLGDVAQSIMVIGTRAYIVVNNSGKIEVVDLPSLKSHCTILGLQSPRYLLPIGNDRALVSDLYSKTISIVNLASCSLEGSIATGAWTEEMAVFGSRVFATQTGTDKLLVIDPASRTLIDSIFVGREPNSLVVDKNGKLWVLCGNALGQAIPQLVRINLDSMAIETSYPFGSSQESPIKLVMNDDRDQLYFLNGGIFKMAISDGNLPAQPWVPQGAHTWYGLGLDPQTGYLYAGDALDFQRRGKIYRFEPNSAIELNSFEVGIIPGGFAFLP